MRMITFSEADVQAIAYERYHLITIPIPACNVTWRSSG
jgi:hypothetical protein